MRRRNDMSKEDDLVRRVDRQVKRMKKAEKERSTIIAQTVYIGTLGLVFVLPVIVGAYLGRWLDGLSAGYSVRWTVSLILIGLFTGALNVYFLVRE